MRRLRSLVKRVDPVPESALDEARCAFWLRTPPPGSASAFPSAPPAR